MAARAVIGVMLLLLALFALPVLSQTQICAKYGGGAANATGQQALITSLLTAALNLAVADPNTAAYFNGTASSTVFTPGSAAFNNMLNSKVAFYGTLLGCTAPGFPAYTGRASMRTVHQFTTAVNQAAYETFNRLFIRACADALIVGSDLILVAKAFDRYRDGRDAQGVQTANDVVCQNADCTSSPYSIQIGGPRNAVHFGNYFNPPYLTVPAGVRVGFTLTTAGSQGHNVNPGLDPFSGGCNVTTGGPFSSNQITPRSWANQSFIGVTQFYTFTETTVPQDYICSIHCIPGRVQIPMQMEGQIIVLPAQTTSSPQSSFRFASPSGDFVLTWNINRLDNTINYVMTGRTVGWIATGIHPNPSMIGGDILWCQGTGPNTGVVIERFATAQSRPPPVSPQEITNVVVTQTTNPPQTVCSFTRPLAPTSPQTYAINGTLYYMSFAMSSVAGIAGAGTNGDFLFLQHNLGNALTTVPVDILAGGSAGTSNGGSDGRRRAHGILMLLAFALFVPLALFIARYFKGVFGKPWMYLHILLNILAMICMIVGFGLIVSDTQLRGQPHFTSQGGHRIIGIVLFIVTITLQAILGNLTNRLYDENRTAPPLFPDRLHQILGYMLWFLGLANCWLGLAMYCVPQYAAASFGTIIFLTAVIGLLFEAFLYAPGWGESLGVLRGVDQTVEAPIFVLIAAGVAGFCLLGLNIVVSVGIGRAGLDSRLPFYDGCTVATLGMQPYVGWWPGLLAGALSLFVMVLGGVILYAVLGRKGS